MIHNFIEDFLKMTELKNSLLLEYKTCIEFTPHNFQNFVSNKD